MTSAVWWCGRVHLAAVPEPPGSQTDEYLDQRLALTRFIADLGLDQPT